MKLIFILIYLGTRTAACDPTNPDNFSDCKYKN